MAMCIALFLLYLSGKYAGRGGNGEVGGGAWWILACERIEDNDGRGPRNDIPSPTVFSGCFGSRLVLDSPYIGTSVLDDSVVVEDRHLKDISENMGFGRSIEVL